MKKNKLAILGIPFDKSSSYLKGSALAPPLIREALKCESSNMWSESGIDLGDMHFLWDAGDLDLSSSKEPLRDINRKVDELISKNNRLVILGGDHAVTYPIITAFHHKFPKLNILHLAKQKAYTLSGGEKRRLEITRAMVTSPSFIMLDEPFSGVDPIAVFDVQQILRELKDKGIGILFTDHSVRETLSIVDRAYIINEGVVECSGTSDELINDPRAKKIYLGEQFTM